MPSILGGFILILKRCLPHRDQYLLARERYVLHRDWCLLILKRCLPHRDQCLLARERYVLHRDWCLLILKRCLPHRDRCLLARERYVLHRDWCLLILKRCLPHRGRFMKNDPFSTDRRSLFLIAPFGNDSNFCTIMYTAKANNIEFSCFCWFAPLAFVLEMGRA